MPKLNSRGDAICGVAGTRGSLNGAPYPAALGQGGGCWIDDDTIATAGADGRLYAWKPFSDPAAAGIAFLDARGYSDGTGGPGIAGGGGRFGAFAAPPIGPVLFGSLGDIAGAGPCSVALDGTLVYKADYYGTYGLVIVAPNGARADRLDAPAWDFQALPGGARQGAGAAVLRGRLAGQAHGRGRRGLARLLVRIRQGRRRPAGRRIRGLPLPVRADVQP